MAPTRDKLRSTVPQRRFSAHNATTGPTWPIRMRCIDLLRLGEGETVLDVGCGTGLNFEPLLERVGRTGKLIAFEPHRAKHAQAELRAKGLRAQGWQIELQCAKAENVKLSSRPDAALFHYVHETSRTPEAIRNLFEQLPPGTRIAIAGMKFFSWWLAPLNLFVWLKNRPYNPRAHELNRPWSLVEPHLQKFTRKTTQAGMGYIGSGRVRGTGL